VGANQGGTAPICLLSPAAVTYEPKEQQAVAKRKGNLQDVRRSKLAWHRSPAWNSHGHAVAELPIGRQKWRASRGFANPLLCRWECRSVGHGRDGNSFGFEKCRRAEEMWWLGRTDITVSGRSSQQDIDSRPGCSPSFSDAELRDLRQGRRRTLAEDDRSRSLSPLACLPASP
jgi:hypothetical protein